MPFIIPLLPIIAAIGSLAGTGVGLGLELSNQPGTPKAAAPPTVAQTTPGADATKTAQEASIAEQFPNLQASTGGSLSPDAWIQLSQMISGTAGTPGVSGTNTDLIQKILTGQNNATVTAGSGGTTPQGAGASGLTNSVFA
jgi:hypothetical protein